MPSRDNPEKYLRWRVTVGDPAGWRRQRWPLAMLGARQTEVPEPAGRRTGRPVGPWERLFASRMVVAAQSVRWLRHLLDHPVSLAKVRRVTLVVDDWHIPQRGWSGRLGPLPHLLNQRIRMPRHDRGRAVVEIELRWSVPLRAVVAAVLPLLAPGRSMPVPASPDLTARDVLPGWLGAGPTVAVVAGELPGSDDIRAHDLVLEPADSVTDGAGAVAPAYRARLAVDPLVAGLNAGPGLVLVDLEHAVATGRYGPFGPDAPRAELTVDPEDRSWRITGPGGSTPDGGPGGLARGRLDRPWLPEEVRAALAGIGLVECRLPGRHPAGEAALLVHLALAGVPVHAPDLPPACRAHLAEEFAGPVGDPLPDRYASDLDWEVRAVRQRRTAMRCHGRATALPAMAAPAFPGVAELPSVTALLVTRRLGYVLDAVAAIEAQTYPELEIVLCLHGVELSAGLRSRLARCGRPLEILTVPAGQSFGAAMGRATARARGSLVTKFDDDDTYGPEHVWDLVLARHHSGATVVGKAAEFVYLETLDTTVRRDAGEPETFTRLIAGGTMLISRGDLEEVGGWRPVPRSVDRGLLDRVRRAGGLVYRTHPLGYVYQRRTAGHTWDPGLEYFLRGGGTQWSGLPRHGEFGTLGPRGAPAR
ncbi:glycosyltransferase [Plantactinospora sp. CA-290183]|uniref:glycosyltransferase n=1 Tax=Plantactinospora sp. CA-290183 TaxID=3240006 RepID=UPI003D8EB3A7